MYSSYLSRFGVFFSDQGVAVIGPLSTKVDELAAGEGDPVVVACSEPFATSVTLDWFGVCASPWVTLCHSLLQKGLCNT